MLQLLVMSLSSIIEATLGVKRDSLIDVSLCCPFLLGKRMGTKEVFRTA